MSFHVEPRRLKNFAGDLDVVAAAARQADGYATYTHPKASGGSAFVRLLNSTAEVQPTAERFFAHLARIADHSADELVAAARYYETTDAQAAARADRTHDAVSSAPEGGIQR